MSTTPEILANLLMWVAVGGLAILPVALCVLFALLGLLWPPKVEKAANLLLVLLLVSATIGTLAGAAALLVVA